jgi:hypothetical protein
VLVCPAALAIVVLCLAAMLAVIFKDARATGGEMLMARYWWRRWPLFLLVIAVVVAIGFAGQYGC